MEVKTADLTGPALAHAVAQAEGLKIMLWPLNVTVLYPGDPRFVPFMPHKDWAVGGPIIDREKLDSFWNDDFKWWSVAGWDNRAKREVIARNENWLVAAMRCYVASKLGDTVEIPDELL